MSPDPQTLQEMIGRDIRAAEALTELLLEERQLLEQRQHEPLAELIERKTPLLEQLAQSAQQRQQWLIEAGLPADSRGWEQLLEHYPEAIRESWPGLREAFERCQELNAVNGKLLSRSQQTLGRLLDLLRGQVAGPQLYNAAGNTDGHQGGHTVARA